MCMHCEAFLNIVQVTVGGFRVQNLKIMGLVAIGGTKGLFKYFMKNQSSSNMAGGPKTMCFPSCSYVRVSTKKSVPAGTTFSIFWGAWVHSCHFLGYSGSKIINFWTLAAHVQPVGPAQEACFMHFLGVFLAFWAIFDPKTHHWDPLEFLKV